MNSDNLVRMANRIGDFFEAMPDRDEALEGIATHLKKFWDPRMRNQFLCVVDAGGTDLKDIVRSAVERHRALLA
ncbi:MAG: formate dehydrogenase subunit delta [Ramlibacter sp.]|nr:formate dehydrogenase subunit delta [Ramlibacter sp.]